MRACAAFFLVALFGGCESKPDEELCARVADCDYAQLLVSEPVCAEQVRSALFDAPADCARCAMALECSAVGAVLRGKERLSTLCATCPESLAVGAAGEPAFLTPAIAVKEGEATLQESERGQLAQAQAEAVCLLGEDCDGAELRLNAEECARQVRVALDPQSDVCRRCAASLSCAGVMAVVHGEQRLSTLCRTCTEAIDPICPPPCSDKPYLVIPGFVAAPPEPTEGEQEAAEEQPAAEAAVAPPPPEKPSAPAPEVPAPPEVASASAPAVAEGAPPLAQK